MGKHPAWLGKAMQTGGRAWSGEGDSGKQYKEEAADLKSKADIDSKLGVVPGGIGTGILAASKGSRAGKIIGSGLAGLGATFVGKAASELDKSKKLSKAGDEAEGRKRGGRASKKKD